MDEKKHKEIDDTLHLKQTTSRRNGNSQERKKSRRQNPLKGVQLLLSSESGEVNIQTIQLHKSEKKLC